jgi:hypothetical protein
MTPSASKADVCDNCGCKQDPETMLSYDYIAVEYDQEVKRDGWGYGSTETTTVKYRNATPMDVVVCRSCALSIRKKTVYRDCSLMFGVPFILSLLLFFAFHRITLGVIASVITVLMSILILFYIKDEKDRIFKNPEQLIDNIKKIGHKKAVKFFNKPFTSKIGLFKSKSGGACVFTPSEFQKIQEASKAGD